MSSHKYIGIFIRSFTIVFCMAVFLLPRICAAMESDLYQYYLEVKKEKEFTYLEVSLLFEMDKESSWLNLRIPNRWGTSANAASGIKNLTVTNVTCNKLLDSIAKVDNIDNLQISIKGCDRKVILIKYFLQQLFMDIELAESKNHYAPVVNESYIRAVVGMALIVPSHKENIRASIEWKNIPNNWVVISGLENGGGVFRYAGDLNGFNQSFFYVTPRKRIKIYHPDERTTIVIDANVEVNDKDLISNLVGASKAVNSIFNNESKSVLVVMTQLKSSAGISSLDGLALENTFWLQLTNDITVEQVSLVYIHELLHDLIPGKMGLSSVRFPGLQWFTEGFTEYLTFKIALSNGIIDKARMINEINHTLLSLAHSRIADLSPDQYSHLYFSPPPWMQSTDEINRIPYWKGFLLALKWDEIIQKSGDCCSLIDAIIDLSEEDAKHQFPLIGPERIDFVMRKYGVTKPESDIDQFIIKNNGPSLTASRYENIGAVKLLREQSFAFGFDYPLADTDSFKISGVEEGSNAYKAGIRDEMTILSASFHFGNSKYPVTLIVRELPEPIEYMPSKEIDIRIIAENSILPTFVEKVLKAQGDN